MAKEKLPMLLVTVGLPRSGKSTWARQQIAARCAVLVSPDEIRLALHGQAYFQSAEDFVWATVKLMVKALFRAGHKIVILDDTFNTKKRRAPWVNFRPWDIMGYEVTTKFMYFRADPEECIIQADKDERHELVNVILQMAERHEPPDDTEYHEIIQPPHFPVDGGWREGSDANVG